MRRLAVGLLRSLAVSIVVVIGRATDIEGPMGVVTGCFTVLVTILGGLRHSVVLVLCLRLWLAMLRLAVAGWVVRVAAGTVVALG